MEDKFTVYSENLAGTESVAILDRQEKIINIDNLDYEKKYSDAAYEDYINNFEQSTNKRVVFRVVKRFFDIFLSLIAIIVLSPLFLILAIAIKVDSKGPVLFKQARIGKNGKIFTCYKFRSMSNEAPHNCPTCEFHDDGGYITKVGKFIRKFSIDELPQLWCCFIGTMSIVGYRPLIIEESECNAMREKLGVFSMRPGITGYAQVIGRDAVYYKNKAILDAEYVKRASILFDIKIVFKTIGVVLSRKGAK